MADQFSVLMSVYYKEQPANFELALRSILTNQTRIPDELILICDGPLNDGLDAVIDFYGKKYPGVFKVFRQETNQGLGKALNFGLSKCTYDLVARADSDDVCAENRFEVQTIFMKLHPEISIISSYIDEFDEDWTKPTKKKELPLTHEELTVMAKFRNPLNHMAVMFRKKDIVEIGSYRHIPYIEDYELWVRAIVEGKRLANIDQVLVHARVGNGMVGRRGNREYIKSWKILNNYMLVNNMVGRLTVCRNIAAVRAFVYMPVGVKVFLYKNVLRK